MRAILFDTETSAKQNGEVIELSFCSVYDDPAASGQFYRNGIDTFRFKPERGISFGACAVHHILPSDLVDAPPFDPELLPPSDIYIGHNVDFDLAFFPNRTPARTIDTLALFRRYLPDGEHTLGAAYYYVAGMNPSARSFARRAHGAETDVQLTFEILCFLQNAFECRSLDELARLSDEARVPTHMSFGKFKGQPINEVDNGWRNWYRRQPDPDPYLLEAFNRFPFRPA